MEINPINRSTKSKLVPLQVPWQISPSVPFLRLYLSESSADQPTHAVFIAHYKCGLVPHDTAGDKSFQIVAPPPAFVQTQDVTVEPYRLVRVLFHNAVAARMLPSFSDTEVIEESAYDWSFIDNTLKPEEGADSFVARFADTWVRSGICPSPGIYEVLTSKWLAQLGVTGKAATARHYLLLGHDAYIEVLAEGCTWQEGQALSGGVPLALVERKDRKTSAPPNFGKIGMVFSDGNLLSTTDPDNDTTWTVYDALNRAAKTVTAQGSGPNDTHYATASTDPSGMCGYTGEGTSITLPTRTHPNSRTALVPACKSPFLPADR